MPCFVMPSLSVVSHSASVVGGSGLKMLCFVMVFECKSSLGQGWRRLEKVRPGGMRGGLCSSQKSEKSAVSAYLFNTVGPQGAGRIQSLRAFRRAQKSSTMRFLTILKIFKKLSFLMVLDLGTSLELNFMQFRIEPTNRRSIS